MEERLEVSRTSEDKLLQEIEEAATEAVQGELQELRGAIDRLEKKMYLTKTYLTLEEAARYASISTQTLREWRQNGLPTAERGGRKYVKRERLDAYIAGE